MAGHPEGGNCLAACLASLLEMDLEAVPWTTAVDRESWVDYWPAVGDFLAARGLALLRIPASSDMWVAPTSADEPGALYIAGGPGPRGFDHSVLMSDGDVLVHDPHPEGDGLLNVRDRSFLVPAMRKGAP
jgi:hypothetical protein